jgi:GntR family transcriptional regulator
MLNAINPKAAIPIYRQIADQIQRAVAAGKLQPGDQLPSVRELAAHLLVNPNTVARVYRDLEREGLLEARRGQGTYVAITAHALADPERLRLITEQLEGVARDIDAFGIPPESAVALFQEIVSGQVVVKGKT